MTATVAPVGGISVTITKGDQSQRAMQAAVIYSETVQKARGGSSPAV
ncbi:MAG: hypothetical protein HOM07_07805 [Rhodospirillaceae bacterium]|nr:hypothetical protein [Rhodospirillaceae bacterium]